MAIGMGVAPTTVGGAYNYLKLGGTAYLPHKDVSFVDNLLQAMQAGKASPKQKEWLVKMAKQAWSHQNGVVLPPIVKKPLVEFFHAAQENIQYPTMTVYVDVIGVKETVRISVAGPKSSSPGSLHVVRKTMGEETYWGKYAQNGDFEKSSQTNDKVAAILALAMDSMGDNPAAWARSFSMHTGKCSFCMSDLTDVTSQKMGYGKKCAQNFNLPWGSNEAVASVINNMKIPLTEPDLLETSTQGLLAGMLDFCEQDPKFQKKLLSAYEAQQILNALKIAVSNTSPGVVYKVVGELKMMQPTGKSVWVKAFGRGPFTAGSGPAWHAVVVPVGAWDVSDGSTPYAHAWVPGKHTSSLSDWVGQATTTASQKVSDEVANSGQSLSALLLAALEKKAATPAHPSVPQEPDAPSLEEFSSGPTWALLGLQSNS